MVKRKRISFSDIDADGYCVVEFYGKQYAWFVLLMDKSQFYALTDHRKYNCEIVHNFERKAMIDFTENDVTVYRQEVNPLKDKNNDAWVVDK